jgi:hypothetical protein
VQANRRAGADRRVARSAAPAVGPGHRAAWTRQTPCELAGGTNYEFQVPIFVLTHNPPAIPPKQDDRLTFTFVGEGIASAVEQAKAAAEDKAEIGDDPTGAPPPSVNHASAGSIGGTVGPGERRSPGRDVGALGWRRGSRSHS